MPFQDILSVVTWWGMLLSIGAIFFPITSLLFGKFLDKGYVFGKALGIAIISYLVFVIGVLHLTPFSQLEIFFLLVLTAAGEIFYIVKKRQKKYKLRSIFLSSAALLIALEELFFFTTLLFWAYVRVHQPDIHGLEKFMDYGFVNSILRADYFPPKDMWLTPNPINYYYFGHLVTAVLTKLSGIPSSISFNLMLATLFAFTFVGGFSLGGNFWTQCLMQIKNPKRMVLSFVLVGIVSGYILSSAGNLHTLYTFFKPYENEHPVPLWQLTFSPMTFPNDYWYPNATRYIYHTIHEFPSYSFVVSDLHGHVVDIPFVLLLIAVLFAFFLSVSNEKSKTNVFIRFFIPWTFIGFLLGIMYMTNALDGLIYLLLSGVVIFFWYQYTSRHNIISVIFKTPFLSNIIVTFASFILVTLPFSLFFKSFVSQIGLVCSPTFLLKIQSIGPFVFEPNHCDRSPWWQLVVLYGFFGFWLVSLGVVMTKIKKSAVDYFMLLLGLVSILLIIIPEIFYLRDIYTTYYRANTMFKLVYQAFMLLSLVSIYSFARTISLLFHTKNIFYILLQSIFALIGLCLLLLVSIYPYFAVGSYYDSFKHYYGLDGTTYLTRFYPDDDSAIHWINTHIPGQPVLLEAPGDSYTDYERISANTGLPTVLGWSVHEWLWHGTYDVVPPRQQDVQTLYETADLQTTKTILQRYHISYVYIGGLEREKYPKLSEEKFAILGTLVYQNSTSRIYQLSF